MEIYNGSAWGSMGPFPFAFTELFYRVTVLTYEFLLSNSVANANDINCNKQWCSNASQQRL